MQLQKEASALEGLGALLKLGEEEDVWPGGVGIGPKAWWGQDENGKRTVGAQAAAQGVLGCVGKSLGGPGEVDLGLC